MVSRCRTQNLRSCVISKQQQVMKNLRSHPRGLRAAALVLATLLPAAWLLADPNPPTADSAAPTAKLAATPAKAAPKEPNTTYLRDVLPVVMGKCARCHNAQCAVLPNWLDYKAAYADRSEIKRRVWDSWKGQYYKQSMPAGNGPECQSITEEERALIRDWVKQGAALGQAPTHTVPQSRPERLEQGKRLFGMVCAACHQSNGQGVPNKFPPLAGSDFLNFDKKRAIKVLIHGRQGEIVVNGAKYNNSMPLFPLSDEDIASALTFVYSSFGNSGKDVTAAEVKAARAEKEDEIPVLNREVAHTEVKSEFE